MKRVLQISNAHWAERINMGTRLEIVKPKEKRYDSDAFELENGIWLKGMRDGRYYTDGNFSECWAEVLLYNIEEVDGEEEFFGAELIGFTQIN